MVLQGGAVGPDLHGGELVNPLLAVEVQLESGQLDAGDDVPQLLVEGVEIVAVRVNGAQQIQGVAVALGFPQQAQGAGVVLVIQGQGHTVGKRHGLQQGAWAVQGQTGAVTVAVEHTQGGQKFLRLRIYSFKGIGGGLHIQGVNHTAAGCVKHEGTGAGALLHAQKRQLVRDYPDHFVQLLLGNRLAVIGVNFVPYQAHGVGIGDLAVGPSGKRLSLGFLRSKDWDCTAQYSQSQQQSK